MTEASEVSEIPASTSTYPAVVDATWLDEHHPERYEIEGEVYLRCPTCEEWAPCRVRVAFGLVDDAVTTVRESVAWLKGNNLTHINEDKFLAAIPPWWEARPDGR